MKRLVSGLQPTGDLHIGNYIGAISQLKELQNEYDAYFFIADYHALTTRPQPSDLTANTLHVAAMLIACGLDPKRATIFIQSSVPEHAELAYIMSNFTSLGQLNRMTQYKEKSDKHGQNAGLYTYPILMAADVAIYDAEFVPVGDDQLQHLELAREIIRSMNSHAGKELCPEPKPLLSHGSRIMALNNPEKKMSKSVAGSAIGMLDDEPTITRLIKRAVTDSAADGKEMSPALSNLFAIMKTVSDHGTYLRFEALYRNGKLHYSELKEQLIDDTINFLSPIQSSYKSLISDKQSLVRMLGDGNKRAREEAQKKLKEIKKTLGIVC